MYRAIRNRLLKVQQRLAETFGTDISTPKARRAAWWHFVLNDHAFLRVMWRNLHQVAPGVWRSNQPSPAQLRKLHAMGIRTVLNLRGKVAQGFYLFEEETCAYLGMTLIDVPLSAKKAPPREKLEEINRLFHSMEKPFVIHCKSGADRTGLVSALYLLLIENRPIEEAQKQLSFRYIHVANSGAGIQDHLLRCYAAAHRRSGVSFLDWMRTEYDPDEVTASFARWRAGDRGEL